MPFFSPSTSAPKDLPPTGARRAWSDSFGGLATRCLQVIIVLVIVIGIVYAASTLSVVTIPVLLALIIASAMHPVVSWLRRHHVPSVLATLAVLLGVLVVLGLVAWLIVVAVESQWSDLQDSAVDGFQQLQQWATSLPFSISESQIDDATKTVTDFITSAQFGSGALAGASATANFLTGLVLMVVVLFFFLKDGPKIWEFLLRPFTGQRYARARRVGDRIVSTLGGYVRGTATVAAVDAIGIGVGIAIVGVPLALPLAVVVFITAFIPIVGATAAGILAALVALVALGPVQALVVIGIVVLVNQLEGNFLQPVLMGRTLRLHGLVILIGLTAGTVLAGIFGAVISVPLLAAAWGAVQVWDGPDQPAKMWRQKRSESVEAR
ncbi:putative PurR-regulated permease PerM [Curtobacterium sp. PhB130]|uniref:AI-2E family transporter n=1 Tax=unclassified Curtobacterium TaxID=257496 RepID=UPI000F4B2934|nr:MULTISPECIES: AI-2E family transporter [unclassified Curtobacterium]ROP58813.1 putative PurR-regulated permease PerM [Curtobacterium sp. ZW137]ROS77334.1 putative PurR-regulated permease PerM [Curtobacterium sp. PhB130]TCK66461.1 putative PurR-regulated permease PerM [Curtobacterium sp. PhB136]